MVRVSVGWTQKRLLADGARNRPLRVPRPGPSPIRLNEPYTLAVAEVDVDTECAWLGHSGGAWCVGCGVLSCLELFPCSGR